MIEVCKYEIYFVHTIVLKVVSYREGAPEGTVQLGSEHATHNPP